MILMKETNLYDDDAISEALLRTVSNIFYDENMFNILTHNGAIQGLFWDNGQVYANMNYLRSGTIKVGGNGNVNGLLEVYNASQTVTCRLNNTGLYAIAGTIGGFTINNTNIHNGVTSLSDTAHDGVYVGTDGIVLGKGKFKATNAGAVTAANLTITGGSIIGSSITLGGSSNGNGTLIVKDASNNNVVTLNNVGVTVTKGTISGSTITVGGANNNGLFEVHNSSGTRIGRIDNTALYYGNIGSNLNSPNTKIDSSGAITTKNLTANDYIYVSGNSTSLIKIPTDIGGYHASLDYTQMYKWGFKYASGSSSVKKYIYMGAIPSSSAGTSYTDGFLTLMNGEYPSAATVITSIDNALMRISGSSTYSEVTWSYIKTSGQLAGGTLFVTGTKSRVVETDSYGERLMYCYETPSPMFGDVGEGEIGEDGKCYVFIDSIFANTVTLSQYQVFLQKYGDGDCWIEEKTSAYFVVCGTAGLHFGWELKAKQSDFDQYRMERFTEQLTPDDRIDYAKELFEHIADIQREREVAA